MSVSWTRSLYGTLGLAMLMFVAVSAVLVGSSFFALERVRADLTATALLSRERAFYQMLYLAGRLPSADDPGRSAAVAELRELMHRNENMLARLIGGDKTLGIAAESDPQTLAEIRELQRHWVEQVRPSLELTISQRSPSEATLDQLDSRVRAYAAAIDEKINSIEENAATRLKRSQILQLGLSGLAVVLLLLVLSVLRHFARRTRALMEIAKKVSVGDLAQKADDDGRDELAVLGLAFNHVTTKLAGMIENERADRQRLEELLATIFDTAQHLSSSAAEILAGTTQQVEGMREQSSAVAETVASVDDVLQTAEQAAQRALQVATSYETAVTVSGEGRKALDDTVTMMNIVNARTEAIAGDILSLAENSLEIGEIVSVVAEIADQTNLLALNAAIEASRAGEHGRGFNVVASEIRALADQSKSATTRVRRILMEIQKSTNAAVVGAEEGSKSVSRALDAVREAGETIRQLESIIADSARSVAQIAASAGQQKAGMKQIHDAMHYIDQTSSQNLSAIRQAEEAARDLNELGARLKDMLADNGNRADEIR